MIRRMKGFLFGLVILLVLPCIVSAHTIHFVTLGDKQFPDVTIEDDETLGLYQYVPELNGYMFDQWSTDENFRYGGGYESWPGDYYWYVKSDMTFYAYFYDRVYTFAYNKTTGKTDMFVGQVVEDDDWECFEGYCEVLEPYSDEVNKATFTAKANPGFRFVEWRVGYSMPAKTHIKDGYQGVSYSETTSAGTNKSYTAVGGNGFVTLYAVFEEDPNSTVQLITEARAIVTEPKAGETINDSITSSDPSKYSVDTGCWAHSLGTSCVTGKFESGNDYEKYAIFVAKDGYRFGNETKFYVNDKLVTVEDERYLGATTITGTAKFSIASSSTTTPSTPSTPSTPTPSTPSTPTVNLQEIKQTSSNTNKLTLSWNKVDNANGYLVQVKNGKKWKTIVTIKNNATTTATVKKLKAGKSYTYKVVAYKNVKKKKKTVKQTVNTTNTIVAITTPSSPKVKVKSNSYNSLKITYKKVTGASKYEIYRSTSSNGTYEKVTEVKALSYVDNNLTTGQTYYYKVKACNNYCSGDSKVASAKPSLAKPSLKVKSSKKGTVTITPSVVAGEDGYVIEYSTKKNKGFKEIANLDYATKEYLQEGLKSKKTFYYRVRAYRVVNGKTVYSSWSSVKKVKTK